MPDLERISLAYGSHEVDQNHGFWRTTEGRRLLHNLYDSFLIRLPYKERKLAGILADENATNPDSEVEITRSAMRRWKANGSVELWDKDPDKSLRVMRRLELEMMGCPPIREILDERAATVFKLAVANNLCGFFQGVMINKAERRNIDFVSSWFESSFFEEILPFDDFDDPQGSRWTGNYIRFIRPKGKKYLLCHEFHVPYQELRDGNLPIIKERYSGFAIPTHDGPLYRFMISAVYPRERLHDRIAPFEPVPGITPENISRRRLFSINRQRTRLYDEYYENTDRYLPKNYNSYLQVADDEMSEALSKVIDRSSWSILL